MGGVWSIPGRKHFCFSGEASGMKNNHAYGVIDHCCGELKGDNALCLGQAISYASSALLHDVIHAIM